MDRNMRSETLARRPDERKFNPTTDNTLLATHADRHRPTAAGHDRRLVGWTGAAGECGRGRTRASGLTDHDRRSVPGRIRPESKHVVGLN